MPRGLRRGGGEPKPIDLAENLQRIDGDRSASSAALAALIERRAVLVVDGTAEEIVEIDRKQSVELAKIEQCDARLAVIRVAIAEADAVANEAASRKAYDEAKAARAEGVTALADLNRHLAGAAAARTRLTKAKRIVAEANCNLPVGCARLEDPEGVAAERGFSLLDQIRLPYQGAPTQ